MSDLSKQTQIVHSALNSINDTRCVNVPMYQSSTLLFNNYSELKNSDSIVYGRHGVETTTKLSEIVSKLEDMEYSMLCTCGFHAISATMLALLSPGDHILIPDNVYSPSKALIKYQFPRLQLEADYYVADDIENVKQKIKSNTKILYLESPGSITFEVQDVEKLVALARDNNLLVVADNTYASFLFNEAKEYDIDVSIQSLTKYPSGHSDILMGSISTNSQKIYNTIQRYLRDTGTHVSPQDCHTMTKHLRTMHVRVKHQEQSALKIAQFLEQHEKIAKVNHPALPGNKHHKLWKKYFSGSMGVFSFQLKQTITEQDIDKFVAQLKLFGIGFGWAGFESLINVFDLTKERTLSESIESLSENEKIVIRLQIGLENTDELIDDITQALNIIFSSVF